MVESRVSAILLAAGASRRMPGRDKLLLPYKGKSLLQRAVELLDSMMFYEKILVTTTARLNQIDLPPKIRALTNSRPESGQSESLRRGLEIASGEWFLFLAADQPLLTQADLQPMFELAEKNPDRIIFPSVNGNPCSPALFPTRYREDLLSLTGDTGGRAVRNAHSDKCLSFDVKNPANFLDIDDEDDYQFLING